MYKVAVILLSVVAIANAQYWGSQRTAPVVQAANTAGAGNHYADAGYGRGNFNDQIAAEGKGQQQGAQFVQGSTNNANGHEHAAANEARGRYDHDASLLAANEGTSAGAEQAGGRYDTAFSYSFSQGSQGAQGAEASAGQFAGDQNGAYDHAGQQAAEQGQGEQQVAYQQPAPVAYQQPAPVAYPQYAYQAPYRQQAVYRAPVAPVATGYYGGQQSRVMAPAAVGYGVGYGAAGAGAGAVGLGSGAAAGAGYLGGATAGGARLVPNAGYYGRGAGYYGNSYPAGFNYGLRAIQPPTGWNKGYYSKPCLNC